MVKGAQLTPPLVWTQGRRLAVLYQQHPLSGTSAPDMVGKLAIACWLPTLRVTLFCLSAVLLLHLRCMCNLISHHVPSLPQPPP